MAAGGAARRTRPVAALARLLDEAGAPLPPRQAARLDCAQCHQALPSHYMMLRMMTRQESARVEQCYLCHQTDSWNSIKGVGRFDMH
ncbi:cytochrome c3 family protein [Roseicella aerolata]|uniref:Doubled CXXCH motif domain-containing protein n=1 Tax=Roseicella aerolata TaxID=2883479 RepID=A0A9X1II51_9PROT|nr:cytochrome c3 family protein [Roseicella aerolata]MCB4824912.1 hypothetical protein [Roseicella aerolata]